MANVIQSESLLVGNMERNSFKILHILTYVYGPYAIDERILRIEIIVSYL
jgi:hypothetical protein